MKTPLGTEVDLGAGHIALDGFPALRERGTAPPLLGPCLLWPRSPISATAELLLCLLCVVVHTCWLVNACFCCVRFSFSISSQEIGLGPSPKWLMLCRVGRKATTQSINQCCSALPCTCYKSCQLIISVTCLFFAVLHRMESVYSLQSGQHAVEDIGTTTGVWCWSIWKSHGHRSCE